MNLKPTVRSEIDVESIKAEVRESMKADMKAELEKNKSVAATINTMPEPTTTVVKGKTTTSTPDDVPCPTCHGHMHKLDGDGYTLKCTGDKCGKEFVMVDKSADFKCAGCGAPIKRPTEADKIKPDTCPFCHGKKAVKFDWNDAWKGEVRGWTGAK